MSAETLDQLILDEGEEAARVATDRVRRRLTHRGKLLGAPLARPWIDPLAVWGLSRWFFPLSRAWAAAAAAGLDEAAFLDQVPMRRSGIPRGFRLPEKLHALTSARIGYVSAAAQWERALFGTAAATGIPGTDLPRMERKRRQTSHRFMTQRAAFLPLTWRGRKLPGVKFDVPSPDVAMARYGALAMRPEMAYPFPSVRPTVLQSRRLETRHGWDSWLRFTSPMPGGGTAWAHVYEPFGIQNPPTVIYCHGIGLEDEMWLSSVDPMLALRKLGLRVVRLESAWHGRRLVPGYHGGEPILAHAPVGSFDMFSIQVAEIAVLLDWARRTSEGPTAVAGVSLGALTSQLAAVHAHGWPVSARPDAALLVATGDRLDEIGIRGDLIQAVGVTRALLEKGWDEDSFRRLRPLADPCAGPEGGLPVMPPDRIVMVLGTEDKLTLYDRGRALADSWGVPADNLYCRYQGHYSASTGLSYNPAPLRRFARLMRAM